MRMIGSRESGWPLLCAAKGGLLLTLALAIPAAAQTTLAPDLHAGGPQPSSIPNHAVTTVALPGFHLLGTTVTASGACALKSYKVISDTEIRMTIEGDLPIDAKDDGCFLDVSKGAKKTGTYVVVELTEAEQHQKDAQQAAAAQAKANAYMAGLGTQWTVRHGDGATEVFTAQPADPGELPTFTSSSGASAKIMTTGDGTVVIVADSCMMTGTLSGDQVKDGKSQGNCKHPGAWTAVKKY